MNLNLSKKARQHAIAEGTITFTAILHGVHYVIQLTFQLIACVSSHYYPKFRAGSNDNSNYKQANIQS